MPCRAPHSTHWPLRGGADDIQYIDMRRVCRRRYWHPPRVRVLASGSAAGVRRACSRGAPFLLFLYTYTLNTIGAVNRKLSMVKEVWSEETPRPLPSLNL